MNTLRAAFVFVLVLGSAAPSAAQAFNLERFRPTLDRFGFIGVQGSATPGHLRWNLGLWTWYSNRPLRVRFDDGAVETAIDHRLSSDLSFELGLFGRWALALEVPMVLYQSGTTTQPLNGRTSFTGFGFADPRVTTKVRILGPETRKAQDRPDGPGLGVLFTAPIPIGSESFYASEGQFSFDLHALADFHLVGAGIGTMLGWRYRVNTRTVGYDQLGQEMLYGFAAKLPFLRVRGLMGLFELRGSTSFRGPNSNTLEMDLGARYTRNAVTMSAAFGGGLVRGLGQPAFRAIFGVSWSPQASDMDEDGIDDADDACPRLPEDLDGFEDEDGCMDPDNDNDFIPDADDLCPNEEALEGRDLDEDGCTDP